MRYVETRVAARPSPQLMIEPGHMGIHDWDVDCFGHDDGSDRDPDKSFRLIFEIGAGYFTCLLVVGMAQPDGLGRFLTFWFKGITAVDVEMEEYGAPWLVEGGPFELPINWTGVTLFRGEAETARYDITGCSFEATTKRPEKPLLTMRWRLAEEGLLWWASDTGWSVMTRAGSRQLDAEEKVTFVNPTATVM